MDVDYELTSEQVRSRFRWALQQGNPQWLWPQITQAGWQLALEEIEQTLRRVLAGKTGQLGLKAGPLEIGIAAYTSGMGPLLGYWAGAAKVSADEPIHKIIRSHFTHNHDRMNDLARHASRLVGELTAAGVGVTLLKGMHTAFSFFPTPGSRPLSDIDLRIRAGDERLAIESQNGSCGPILPWAVYGRLLSPYCLCSNPNREIRCETSRAFYEMRFWRLIRMLHRRWKGRKALPAAPGSTLIDTSLSSLAAERRDRHMNRQRPGAIGRPTSRSNTIQSRQGRSLRRREKPNPSLRIEPPTVRPLRPVHSIRHLQPLCKSLRHGVRRIRIPAIQWPSAGQMVRAKPLTTAPTLSEAVREMVQETSHGRSACLVSIWRRSSFNWPCRVPCHYCVRIDGLSHYRSHSDERSFANYQRPTRLALDEHGTRADICVVMNMDVSIT